MTDTAGVSEKGVIPEESVDPPRDPARDPALRSRLRKILLGITILCLILGAAGYAFVQWMASLPPGTLKKP